MRLVLAVAAASVLGGAASLAADMVPYRAHYALSLVSTNGSSGVVGASGALLDEWDRTCGGWTEQEHFYLHLDYDEESTPQDSTDSYSSLASWEASDGSRFRFDLRRASTDEPYEEVRGEARLQRSGGGTVVFERPHAATLKLPRGALFPAADTRFLIARAEAGDRFVGRRVFDGSDLDNAGEVTAVIGPRLAPHAGREKSRPPHAALLDRPSWRIRLAFFPTDPAVETPDYEESVRLLDNGVLQDMLFDYGDYSVHAKLERIEALPRPHC